MLAGLLIGPASVPPGGALREILDRLPFVSVDSGLDARQAAIVWELRFPRVVLGALVGAALSVSGAAYQGVFRNPLADPYLLGVAAGAGLGATIVIVSGAATGLIPVAAFIGAVTAVVVAYALGSLGGAPRSGATLILAGVAVAAFFTAAQTFVQQQHADTIREVFTWILGRLTTSGWSEVAVLAPYTIVGIVVILLHRRLLDVLAVGEEEAATLGVDPARVRVTVVAAATLSTAAAVAVSGLIGFVGIIVPHTLRLMVGASYRSILPLAVVGGAAFLVVADLAARTVLSPAEIPIGVVTAFVGAPFFALVLQTSRRGVS
ncbi:MAG: iron ABC transporter permease [Actinobacteria bacterium]|nr:iron ABC transporter permease [Actinomycetota bacterium]